MIDLRSTGKTLKCKIPEYLRPLPRISESSAKCYQIEENSPTTLLEECCKALESVKILKNVTPAWQTLEIIGHQSSKIVTDSFRQLCQVKDPMRATQLIVKKSESLGMTPCEYLDSIKLIRLETVAMSTNEKLLRHWEKLSENRCQPRILFGRVVPEENREAEKKALSRCKKVYRTEKVQPQAI